MSHHAQRDLDGVRPQDVLAILGHVARPLGAFPHVVRALRVRELHHGEVGADRRDQCVKPRTDELGRQAVSGHALPPRDVLGKLHRALERPRDLLGLQNLPHLGALAGGLGLAEREQLGRGVGVEPGVPFEDVQLAQARRVPHDVAQDDLRLGVLLAVLPRLDEREEAPQRAAERAEPVDGLGVVGRGEEGLAAFLDGLGNLGDGLLELEERGPARGVGALDKPEEAAVSPSRVGPRVLARLRNLARKPHLKAGERAGGERWRRVGKLLHDLLDKRDVAHGKDQVSVRSLQLGEELVHVLPPQAVDPPNLAVKLDAPASQRLGQQLRRLARARRRAHPDLRTAPVRPQQAQHARQLGLKRQRAGLGEAPLRIPLALLGGHGLAVPHDDECLCQGILLYLNARKRGQTPFARVIPRAGGRESAR